MKSSQHRELERSGIMKSLQHRDFERNGIMKSKCRIGKTGPEDFAGRLFGRPSEAAGSSLYYCFGNLF